MKKLAKVYGWVRGLFPKRLPIGASEFEAYCSWLFDVYGIPSMDSYRHAVASMVMHLAPTKTSVRPLYFARCIKKAQANEVAYQTIQDLKAKAKREAEAMAKVAVESVNNVSAITDASKPSA